VWSLLIRSTTVNSVFPAFLPRRHPRMPFTAFPFSKVTPEESDDCSTFLGFKPLSHIPERGFLWVYLRMPFKPGLYLRDAFKPGLYLRVYICLPGCVRRCIYASLGGQRVYNGGYPLPGCVRGVQRWVSLPGCVKGVPCWV